MFQLGRISCKTFTKLCMYVIIYLYFCKGGIQMEVLNDLLGGFVTIPDGPKNPPVISLYSIQPVEE